MKLFKCQNCHQIIHFENTRCEKCSSRLGYIPEQGVLTALEADSDFWRRLRSAREEAFRFCANADHQACNWLMVASSAETLCLSCRHNRTIPDLSLGGNLVAWRKMELAKHRLFYSLLKFQLSMPTVAEDPENGLAFDFLAELPAETWAHYLHIVDTLEMAASFGMSTHPALARDDMLDAAVDFAPYRADTMAQLVESWLPLSVALNCLNRSMGQPDLYPFVLSEPAIDKLAFVHGLVHPA
jgi:hypothetical protein